MVMKVIYRKVYKVIAYELTDNGLKRSRKEDKQDIKGTKRRHKFILYIKIFQKQIFKRFELYYAFYLCGLFLST